MLPNFLPPEETAFFLKILLIYFLFLLVLGLSLLFQGLSLVAVGRVYSLLQSMGFPLLRLLLLQSKGYRGCGLQQLRFTGSRAQAQQWWHTGLSSSVLCGIFPDHVSCIARQIPNHCTTKEVPFSFTVFFFKILSLSFPKYVYIKILSEILPTLRTLDSIKAFRQPTSDSVGVSSCCQAESSGGHRTARPIFLCRHLGCELTDWNLISQVCTNICIRNIPLDGKKLDNFFIVRLVTLVL